MSSADRVPIGADGLPINNKQYRDIVDYLRFHEWISNAIVGELLDIKATRAKVILREMVESNLLEARGEKRYRRYYLKLPLSGSSAE